MLLLEILAPLAAGNATSVRLITHYPFKSNLCAADNLGMQSNFKKAMAKMAVIGQNKAALTDCSEVIPSPKFNNFDVPASIYPWGKGFSDLQLKVWVFSCIIYLDPDLPYQCPNILSQLTLKLTLGVTTSVVRVIPKALFVVFLPF